MRGRSAQEASNGRSRPGPRQPRERVAGNGRAEGSVGDEEASVMGDPGARGSREAQPLLPELASEEAPFVSPVSFTSFVSVFGGGSDRSSGAFLPPLSRKSVTYHPVPFS